MNQDTSGLYRNISALGNAIALGVTVMGTPMAFDATKVFLYSYFHKMAGAEFAGILVWVMAAIEAYMIYAAVSFLFTSTVVWIMTALAVRRFRE